MKNIVTDPVTGAITLEDTSCEIPWGDVCGTGVVENIQNIPITVNGGSNGQVLGLQTIDSVQQIVPITVNGLLNVAEATTATQAGINYAVMGAMTLTPPAGTYLVLFTGDIQIASSYHPAYMGIYFNEALVSSSVNSFNATNADSISDPPPEYVVKAAMGNFCCQALISTNGTQVVEGRWKSTTGSTATNNHRALSVIYIHG